MKKYLLGLVSLLPFAASAHPGHGLESFSSGFMHPISGWDHLLMAVAVGVLCARLKESRGRDACLAWPLIFAVSMAAGALLARAAGVQIAEFWVALSLVAIGAVMLLNRHCSLPTIVGALVACGAIHGLVHGMESGSTSVYLQYVAGLALTTVVLHMAGVGMVLFGEKRAWGERIAQGISVACVALGLVALAA